MQDDNGDDKPAAPVVYTELIDADIVGETAAARKLIFGRVDRWVPKAHSKVIDDRVFIARWLARKELSLWNGQFIVGSQMTRMRPFEHPAQEHIVVLIKTLQEFIDKLTDLT